MKVKRGHIESVRNQAEFFVNLSNKLQSISHYQNEYDRLKSIIKFKDDELKRIKAENEMLVSELLKKSDYIYNLENNK